MATADTDTDEDRSAVTGVLTDDESDEDDSDFSSDEQPSENKDTNIEKFLNRIHRPFLHIVQPIQSGLTDELIAKGVIDLDDVERIQAGVTTTDRARRLWDILHYVHPREFAEKCMPVLKKLYSHVLQGAEFCWYEQANNRGRCLRHDLVRGITVNKFADMLPSTECCSSQEYRNILDNPAVGEARWKPIFRLLKKNCQNPRLIEMLRQVLQDMGLGQHFRIALLKRHLRSGLPCKCRAECKKVLTISGAPPVAEDEDDVSSGTGYPDFTTASELETRSVSDSITSEIMEAAEQVQAGNQESISEEMRATYARCLRNIGTARGDVCHVKAHFRELETICDQLSTMHNMPEAAPPAVLFKQQEEYLSLENKAQDTQERLGLRFIQVKSAFLSVAGLCSELKNIPPSYKKQLLSKRHLLDNDIREAEHFFQRSSSLENDIVTQCGEKISQIQRILCSRQSFESCLSVANPESDDDGDSDGLIKAESDEDSDSDGLISESDGDHDNDGLKAESDDDSDGETLQVSNSSDDDGDSDSLKAESNDDSDNDCPKAESDDDSDSDSLKAESNDDSDSETLEVSNPSDEEFTF